MSDISDEQFVTISKKKVNIKNIPTNVLRKSNIPTNVLRNLSNNESKDKNILKPRFSIKLETNYGLKSSEEFLKIFVDSNSWANNLKDEIKVIKIIEYKFVVIIEVTNKYYNLFNSHEVIKYNNSNGKMQLSLIPIQCQRCLKFGHLEKNCFYGSSICKICGLQGHSQCKLQYGQKYNCFNCQHSHMATDKCCPKFIQFRNSIIKNFEKYSS